MGLARSDEKRRYKLLEKFRITSDDLATWTCCVLSDDPTPGMRLILVGGSCNATPVGTQSSGFQRPFSFFLDDDSRVILFNNTGADQSLLDFEARSETGELRFHSPAPFPEAFADTCLLYTSPSPRDATLSRMPSSA